MARGGGWKAPGGDLRDQADDFRRRTGVNRFDVRPEHDLVAAQPGAQGAHGRSDQTAMAQTAAQGGSCAREPAANGSDRQAQACGGLVVREALQVTKRSRVQSIVRSFLLIVHQKWGNQSSFLGN